MIPFVVDDGGRAEAGYEGPARDCATRAVAIATGLPYKAVYDALNVAGKAERASKGKKRSTARTGVHTFTMRQFMGALGWNWTPTMHIGSGCTVHLRADELPSGRLVLSLSRHYTAVLYGVLHDTHDCSRDGARCVYGFWSEPGSIDWKT